VSSIFTLGGRTAFVSGAGQGVGRQICLYFAQHGAGTVIVNDLVGERAQAVAAEIEALGTGTRALPFAADVTRWEELRSTIAALLARFGGIDVLVNNAGNAGQHTSELLARRSGFLDTEPASWGAWIDVNYFAPMYLCRLCIPGMVEKRWGRVINVISDAGRVGEPNLVVYSSAKAGAAGFTRALAKEVGKHGVTANCIALGATHTPATAASAERVKSDPQAAAKLLSRYVIKRYGEPADAAAAVVYLASEASGWVTGQTLPVNGGYSMTL
jgi:3-oxoacyl-[acyl-carrier protein] reductase